MDRDLDKSDLIGPEGIFLRIADRRRLEYVMAGVRDESLSLALSSDIDGVLDHYGRLLINKLRKIDSLQVEVFLPQNTEALLERFNQIVAGLSIDEARNAETSQAPRRVLLAHDAKAISERDLQLLSRLVQDFPGAHVSIVLLVDKAGNQIHEKTLEKFGQRLLRWPLEAPTREEGESLLEAARAIGFDVEVKKVLASTGYSKQAIAKAATTATAPTTVPADEKILSGRELAEMRKNALKNSSGRTEPSLDAPVTKISAKPERVKRRLPVALILRWTAALMVLLFVAATVILLLFPQRLGPMLYSSPLLNANLPEWAMKAVGDFAGKPPSAQLDEAKAAAAKEVAASVPATTADSSDKKTESNTASEPASKAEAPAEAKPEARAESTTVTAPVKSEAVKPDAVKTDAVKAESAKTEAPAKPVTVAEALAPRSERGADESVRQARPGSYFVQHVSLSAMAEAQEWRAQYAALKKSRIAAVATPEQGVKFVVLSGPFKNLKEAESFSVRPGVPGDPWLRPVKSLQRALVNGGR